MIPRTVAAEVLDGLAADDPAAMRSRRDLRRVHRAMGTRSIAVRALKAMTVSWRKTPPRRVLELGAGDGTLMLGVARAGRHEVLDRQHARIALGQGGCQPRIGDRRSVHRNVHRVGQIHPPEHDARVDRRGAQRQLHPLAAVQAHAHCAGHGLEGALFQHAAHNRYRAQSACLRR